MCRHTNAREAGSQGVARRSRRPAACSSVTTMEDRMRRICLALGAIAAAPLFLTTRSDAGQGQTTNNLICKHTSYGGFCVGNFWSAHYQGQSSDYVEFIQGSDPTTTSFSAVVGGSFYSCFVAFDNTALQNWWPR